MTTDFSYLGRVVVWARTEWRLRSWQRRDSTPWVKLDPAATARIRKYMALSMVERYGAHGPP